MTSPKSNLRLVVLAAVSLNAASCNTVGKAGNGARAGSGAVLASIGGLSEADTKLPDFGFFLICTTGVRIKGDASKDAAGKDVVSFAGNSVKDQDVCRMEITAKVDDPKYTWFGYDDKGAPIKGLLYGSDERTVVGKALKLQLYTLFSVKPVEDTFSVVASVDFKITDPALTPADAKASANLLCGADQFPGTYKKVADKQASLTFDGLTVKAFADRACERLVVLVDKKEAFSATVKDLAIKAPKKGVPMTFPAAANTRYTLEASTPGGIDVDATLGDLACMRYAASTAGGKKCLDRVEVTLPYGENYLIARVEGKLANGTPVAYFMVPGPNGVGKFVGTSLTIAAANAVLAKDATDAVKGSFHFYQDAAIKDALSTFDTPALLNAGKVPAVDLKDMAGVTLLNLATVSVHGFHPVDDKTLNAVKDSATWMALVSAKATKATDKDQTFLAAGAEQYFHSAKPLIVADKPVYLDTASFVADIAAPTPPEHFRLYAVKGQACSADLPAIASGLPSDGLVPFDAPGNPITSQANNCELKIDAVKALGLENYTLTYSYLLWSWYDLAS